MGRRSLGALKTQFHRGKLSLEVEVYLACLDPSDVRVEVYADSPGSAPFARKWRRPARARRIRRRIFTRP